ncbi:hydroxyethylthiazole kinase [Clostridium sp. DJ247]|uniref:hydroxyethylthiazole kinase n=1 Tax=Clostridium sp. DJ247 TaxID=2726188 RepID=UPI0016266DB1|nr:hydroxyethylthiazole kinase [Clostridium sp. DJ247]MBC2581910.1 hydroxyethylthiazole kinase [Clostridium sp. DJ247]
MQQNIYSTIQYLLSIIKEKKPLIHHITNYVTVNDCANIVLAIGASPIMADTIEEVEDIVSLASALVLNMGTLSKEHVEAMLVAGKKANELGIPVILDPVGVGAAAFRNKSAEKIINEVRLAVIRGNMSEIKSISGLSSKTKGVDASEQDIIQSEDLEYGKNIAEQLASKLNCVIAITGATDTISKEGKTIFINKGHKMLSTVTGTGCMCTSLIGTYCAVTKDYFSATVAGILTMGLAGEKAYEKLTSGNNGSASFKVKLIDSIFNFKYIIEEAQ